jgi:hypothetical protein
VLTPPDFDDEIKARPAVVDPAPAPGASAAPKDRSKQEDVLDLEEERRARRRASLVVIAMEEAERKRRTDVSGAPRQPPALNENDLSRLAGNGAGSDGDQGHAR